MKLVQVFDMGARLMPVVWWAIRGPQVLLLAIPLGMCPSGRPWSASDCSYLVDPASSHMLVSKIKPCMSKYKQLYGETANGSLNQL
jgi:hypothetical protein